MVAWILFNALNGGALPLKENNENWGSEIVDFNNENAYDDANKHIDTKRFQTLSGSREAGVSNAFYTWQAQPFVMRKRPGGSRFPIKVLDYLAGDSGDAVSKRWNKRKFAFIPRLV